MEGATLSGRQTSAYICDAGEELVALRKELVAQSKDDIKYTNTKDELSLVWEKYSDKLVTLYEESLFSMHVIFYVVYLIKKQLQDC